MQPESKPLTDLAMVSRAMTLAQVAHEGQFRVDPNTGLETEPYVFHPVRVASSLEGFDLKAVALLHDVVEDTHWTLNDLRTYGFPEHVVEAVDAITRRKPPKWPEKEAFLQSYIPRVSENALATRVKLADMDDNSTDLNWKDNNGVLTRYAKATCVLHAARAHMEAAAHA